MSETEITKEAIRERLAAVLEGQPAAAATYGKLADYKRDICLRWISEAPDALLVEQRTQRLVRELANFSWFDPYYFLAGLTLSELEDLYGPPQVLNEVSSEERALALQERRVLGATHTRNFDDGGTAFWILSPTSRCGQGDLLLVYARPCVLMEKTVEWLGYNNWESMQEVPYWPDPDKRVLDYDL